TALALGAPAGAAPTGDARPVGALRPAGAPPAGAAPAAGAARSADADRSADATRSAGKPKPAGNDAFVTRVRDDVKLGGKPFPIAGTNNYYLMYKSKAMVDDVLDDAAAAKFTVLRTWGWLDIGNQDGTNSVAGIADGVYFQYWDGQRPAYNDGPNGLQRLDYIIWKAKQNGIRLVIPFTNNWGDFGGMDQYVRWRGGTHHDDFYTDPTIRQWYKDWIAHVLNRVNPLTGLAYKDDPTIMTWELANEPRCVGSGHYPRSAGCTTDTLVRWADEMSRHVKSVDRRHLTSVGDEGFFCDDPAATDWTTNCGDGVDTVRLAALPAIDVMSYHLYPDHWSKTPDWGTDWIRRHIREADRIGKPSMLGEFGIHDKAMRNVIYQEWTDEVIKKGGDGFLYWILSGVQDDGSLYPDYDGFTVYCPSPVCQNLTNAARNLAGTPPKFQPVADHDNAATEFDTPVVLRPATNDIAYGTTIVARTIDLRPDLAGQQFTATVPGGTFTFRRVGTVTFTPTPGFSGRASAPYVVRDHHGRESNVATITVTVRPGPAAPATVFSFEDGAQGWAAGNWQADPGTVAQTDAFHTEGSHGLRVNSNGPFWFGATLAQPLDLTRHTTLSFDLRTGASGTSPLLALQTGAGLTWCQGSKPWVPAGQTATVSYDILTDLAACTDLNDVRGLLIFFSPGTFEIDNVRIS
ncbi:MAG TPA: cellulase family glycosylhydrolase, partial [Catenuloplanes sp.]